MTDSDEVSDIQLVDHVLSGQTNAFSELVRRHQCGVYRLGLSFFKNAEDSSDFVQDVFIKAYLNLGSFRKKSKFSTWLFRIAYNTGINATKRKNRYEPIEDDIIPDELTPEKLHLRKETFSAIKQAMSNLTEKQAICVDLHFYHELEYSDISKVTGFPVNTIKSHVFRAKQELKNILKKVVS